MKSFSYMTKKNGVKNLSKFIVENKKASNIKLKSSFQ